MDGVSTALGEITLVLFTTLAPSGAVAYLLMNLPVLCGRTRDGARRRLDRLSCLPLAITMAGLVASATHLGNPSNALYVFAGVGRSPLSTEVFCAVIFLALAGVYWLYSFAEAPRRGLQRVLLVAIDLAAVAFVIATAYAYDVDTIITWSLPLVPVSLVLNALVGGPVLTLLCFGAACYRAPWRLLLAMAVGALAANVVVYGIIGVQLATLGNELVRAADLVPGYPLFVASYALLALAGIAVAWRYFARGGAPTGDAEATSGEAPGASPCNGMGASACDTAGTEGSSQSKGVERAAAGVAAADGVSAKALAPLLAASLLVLAGIFIMRFTFYMAHLTIGLGV